MIRVPVMLTFSSFAPSETAMGHDVFADYLLRQVGDLGQERVGGGEPQRNTGTDNEGRVDQAGQQEHLGLQLVHQFGLAGGGLEVLAAHDADTDAGTDSAEADDQAGGQCDKADNFHELLLEDLVDVKRKRKKGKACFSGRRAPGPDTPAPAS